MALPASLEYDPKRTTTIGERIRGKLESLAPGAKKTREQKQQAGQRAIWEQHAAGAKPKSDLIYGRQPKVGRPPPAPVGTKPGTVPADPSTYDLDYGTPEANQLQLPPGVEQQEENIFKYTPQSDAERQEFGSAIFSDTAGGATPGGFNEAIQQGGQGVFGIGETPKRTDAFGNSLDIADSMNRAAETMRQSRIGAQQQQQPQGRPQAQPVIGQPQVNQFQQAAMDIMKNLPSGKPGDYRKRQSMLKQAEILSGMGQQQIGAIGDQRTAQVGMANVAQRGEEAGVSAGIQQQRLAQQQQAANRDFAMQQFGLMNPPAKEEQLIKPYKTGEGVDGPTYSQPQAWTPGGNLRSIGQQTTGQAGQQAPPVAGAERAQDGNWYVQQGKKWFQVEQ